MHVCRCDPTKAPADWITPAVFRAVLRVNGVVIGHRLVLHCRRCNATWPGAAA